jgi:GST-like protein
MFQMGGLGPMLGQLGFFYKFAGAAMEDPTARDRYIGEAKRLLAVLDKQLEGKDWITGDYSIADIAIAPWLNSLDFYGAKEVVGYHDLKNVPAYVDRFYARPAVEKAKNIPPVPGRD